MDYKELEKLILDNLNDNNYGVIFDVDIFNSEELDYDIEYNNTDDYGVTVKRAVPTMITSPFGDNLAVPDTYAIDGSMNIVFDIFIDDETKFVDLEKENRFKSVNYHNTLSAIQDFTKKMLVKTNPLGEVALFFGGKDSNLVSSGDITSFDSVYIKLDIQDFYNEDILTLYNGVDEVLKLSRTKLGYFNLTIDGYTLTSTTQYSLGEQELFIKRSATQFSLNDDVLVQNIVIAGIDNLTMGKVTGLNAKVYDVRIGETTLTYNDISSVDLQEWSLMFNDFIDNKTITNMGSATNWLTSAYNSVLWGKGGNIIFGFTTLVPDDGIDTSKAYRYQLFSLNVPFLHTKDVIFGSAFRYYLNIDPDDDGVFDDDDDFEVFAIDRQHTYAGEDNTFQGINSNVGKGVIAENMKGLTKTFLYKPNREITELLRKIMTSDIEQNKKYRIRIQAPFFNVSYICYVNGGGNGTEFYSYSTFTLEFKEFID